MACESNLTFQDSQASPFFYNAVEYGATSVSLSVEGEDSGDQTVDISTLALDFGCCRQKAPPPLKECGDTTSDGIITLNFLSHGVVPPLNTAYQLIFSKFGIDQLAVCTGYTLDAQVGEYVTGTATFDLQS